MMCLDVALIDPAWGSLKFLDMWVGNFLSVLEDLLLSLKILFLTHFVFLHFLGFQLHDLRPFNTCFGCLGRILIYGSDRVITQTNSLGREFYYLQFPSEEGTPCHQGHMRKCHILVRSQEGVSGNPRPEFLLGFPQKEKAEKGKRLRTG